MYKIFSVLIAALILPSCTWSIPHSKVTPVKATEQQVDASKSFYLAVGPDGQEQSFWNHDYHKAFESGRVVSNQIYNFLKAKGYKVSLATTYENEKDALVTAKAQGYDYLLYPKTNFWMDPAYMVCGGSSRTSTNVDTSDWHDSDEADVDLLLFETQTGQLVSNYNLHAVGCPVVFFGLIPVGTTTPEGHLSGTLKDWLEVQTK